MKKLIQYFVNNPIFSYIMIPVLLIGGITSFINMKRSFFPERTSRDITVSVFYPGASPKEMEEGITTRIEQAVRSIVGIKEINSSSSENFSSVNITTTGEFDIDETWLEVKNAIDGISSFPAGAERPIVFKVRDKSFSNFLSINGDIDLLEIKRLAYKIEDDFLASGLISQITLTGFPDEEISVEIHEETLLRYGITFDQIANAISMNNSDIAAGEIKNKKEEILIRSRYRTVDPNKIGDIVIKASEDGNLIRIRDLGKVKIKFADVSKGYTLNGKTGISIAVFKLIEEDLLAMTDFIQKYVEDFNQKHPEVTLELTYSFKDILDERLELLESNGIFGLILVLVALAFFLNMFLSMWVAWGIPASFLAMFIIANMYGLTVNMMSLFGMILVIGILVDDGIVIGENIFAHFEIGKTAKRAAIDGTAEVLPAVMTSVTTTVVAFIPVMIMSQGGMEMMNDVGFVVVVSLVFSLFEAFFILPSHLSHKWVLRNVNKENPVRGFVNKIIKFLRQKTYGNILKFIIKWRWVALFTPISMILITAGLFMGGLLKFTLFPPISFDMFELNMAFTPGTGEAKTIQYLKNFEDNIWELNEELSKETGDSIPYMKYCVVTLGSAFSGTESGSHAGMINVYFNNMEGRKYSSLEVGEKLREKMGPLPELDKYTITGNQGRWGKPVSISLLGKKLDELEKANEYLKNRLSKYNELVNVSDNNPLGKQEVNLKLKPEAYILGLNQASLTSQVRQGFYGGQAQRLQRGKDELRVWVRYPKGGRVALGQLEKMKIKTATGEYPLTEIADYTLDRSPVIIKRYNLSREIKVEADLVDQNASSTEILERIQEEVIPGLEAKFPNVRVEYMGQQKAAKEASMELMKNFAIAFLIIIIIIIIHFKSFSQTWIILMMIPLGFLGALWGHFFRGIPVSMLSFFGMVALTGVIINDAVVFLSKYNSLLKEGSKIEDAIYNTGIARFRAIMLTTVTTVVGLFPLILETSFQAQFLIPMAATLAFGVFFGTGFILLFLPAIILTYNDVRYALFKLWWGKAKTCEREDLEPAIINARRENLDALD